MEFIKGEDREQIILLPQTINEYVTENSPVRVIDAYINSVDPGTIGLIRKEPKRTGRPPYDPKDLLKLYIYGYMNRIRSSRRLEIESHRNLEVLWLIRNLRPDHKTISNFRKDNAKVLKNVFIRFVNLCDNAGLYGKELASIDGSKFKAVNSKDRNFTKKKLQNRLKQIEDKIEKYLSDLDETDGEEEEAERGKSTSEIKEIIEGLKSRKEKYQAYEEELQENGETQKSLTDTESRLMLSNGKMDVCYNVQAAVDSKNKLIIDYEVTNHVNDMNLLTPMAQRVKAILGTEKMVITADTGYASASDIAACVQIGVEPHVSGIDSHICIPATEGEQEEIKSHINGRSVYLKDRNIVICPMGKPLYPAHYKKTQGEAVFQNSKACKTCDCRCTKEKGVFRYQFVMKKSDFKKDYNDEGLIVKQVHIKPQKEIYKQRKLLSEHPFGTIKRSMDGGYCLTKGIMKTTGEFALLFLAYNLKRVINILGTRKLISIMADTACTA